MKKIFQVAALAVLCCLFGCESAPDPMHNLIVKDARGHYYVIQKSNNGGYSIEPVQGIQPNF